MNAEPDATIAIFGAAEKLRAGRRVSDEMSKGSPAEETGQ